MKQEEMNLSGSRYKALLVIEDHKFIASAIRIMIGDWFEHFYHASTGAAGIAMAEDIEPAMVVIDHKLPDMSGQQITREIRKLRPAARMLGYSFNIGSGVIVEMAEAGLNGYVDKSSDSAAFADAAALLLEGKDCFPIEVADMIRPRAIQGQGQEQGAGSLSAHETKILRLLCLQKPLKEIGLQTGLSERVVEDQYKEISRRLGIMNNAGLKRFALQHGIIDLEDL